LTVLLLKHEHAVDPLTLAALREVDRLARELGLDYFVVGAMARDMLLTGVHGIAMSRATRDLDFAIAVDGWPQFAAIKARLVAKGTFAAEQGAQHRLYYKPEPNPVGYPVDLIPFEDIESPSNTIAWPPDAQVMMNVAGYKEALAAAEEVEVTPGLVVQIASLAGLAMLKIFAWSDRGAQNSNDAQDLAILLRNYGNINLDRLLDTEIALYAAAQYDADIASPRLLGRDVRAIAEPGCRNQLQALLDDPGKQDRLAIQMAMGMRDIEDGLTQAQRMLSEFRAGLTPG